MQYDEFVQGVGQRAGIDEQEDAERTSIVVLEELCNRLPNDEAHDLLSQLPARLKTAVDVMASAEPSSADAFVDRVSGRLEISPEDARSRVRAVFAMVRRAVSQGQFEDVLSDLDPEYADLLA